MRTRAIVTVICVALASASAVRAQQESLGCFDVSLGSWSPIEGSHTVPDAPLPGPPDTSPDSTSLTLPSRIELSAAPSVRPMEGLTRVLVPSNTLPTPHAFQSWTFRADTLIVAFSTGFTGTRSRLTELGLSWSGVTETFSDQHGYLRYRRPIRLDPVSCDAAPRQPASLDPPLLRRVDLASGQTLALHEPLPPGVDLHPRRTGAWTADVAVSGFLAGHDTVVVRLDDGRVVHHIELRYPEGFDIGPIAERLRGAFPSAEPYRSSLRWLNRTTSVILWQGPRPSLVLRDRRYF